MFSLERPQKITKSNSSPSIWHLLSKRQIDSEDFVIFVAFLENMNFKGFDPIVEIIGAFQFHASIAEALAKFSWDLDTW